MIANDPSEYAGNELGFAKPDAGYFKTIMKRIDVAPDRVLFIDEVRYGIHL